MLCLLRGCLLLESVWVGFLVVGCWLCLLVGCEFVVCGVDVYAGACTVGLVVDVVFLVMFAYFIGALNRVG